MGESGRVNQLLPCCPGRAAFVHLLRVLPRTQAAGLSLCAKHLTDSVFRRLWRAPSPPPCTTSVDPLSKQPQMFPATPRTAEERAERAAMTPYEVHKKEKYEINEYLIAVEQVKMLQEKLSVCYLKSGPNHFEDCKELREKLWTKLNTHNYGAPGPARSVGWLCPMPSNAHGPCARIHSLTPARLDRSHPVRRLQSSTSPIL